MKKNYWKKGLAVLLGAALSIRAPLGGFTPAVSSLAYTERPAKINATSLNVRSGAGTSYSAVARLARGTAVTVAGEARASDGKLWYQIHFTSAGTAKTGYVLGTYLKFEANYQYNANFEAQLSNQGFPESYKAALRQLHAQFPNWVFEAQKTGLDWNTAVQNEMVLPRSLVQASSISSFKSMADGAYNWDNSTWVGFDGNAWVAASQEILSYYMDPRNFLDEVYIFQFVSHQYDPAQQTREGLQNLVKGTFLGGTAAAGASSSGSGALEPGGGGSGTGSSSSGSPGASSNTPSGTASPGVILSPSGGKGASPRQTGPSPSTGGPSGKGASEDVQLVAPQASISPKKTALVAASVTVGARPGSDTGSGDGANPAAGTPAPSNGNGTQPSPGSGTVSVPSQASRSYVDIIMDAAAQSGVNPYVLAAMILQEQGSDGRGRSISGTVSGYGGYYNYFNIGAYASGGMGAVERGLWYASQNDSYGRPWDTPEKSILGGARFYGDNYVKAGQDTFYLKKYNVQGSNMYKHQYMTNVDGAASEACFFAEAYSGNMKNIALKFRIPVYDNMPQTACAKPTGDGSANNKLGSLGVEGFSITPTFSRDTERYDLIVAPSVSYVSVYANALDPKASINGTGSVQLTDGTTDITVQVTAQNGTVRNYTIHVVRQGGGSAQSGLPSPVNNGGSSPGTSWPAAGTGPGGSSGTGQPVAGSASTAPTPGGSNVTIIN